MFALLHLKAFKLYTTKGKDLSDVNPENDGVFQIQIYVHYLLSYLNV